MSKEISPITRLKSSLTYLRENEQIKNVALLNKRKGILSRWLWK